MNILELQDTLESLNINMPAKELAGIMGMEESSFSRKKKNKSPIKYEHIKLLESKLNINLTLADMLNNESLKPAFDYLKSENSKSIAPAGNNQDIVSLDYYEDVYGSCGTGSFVFSESTQVLQVPKNIIFGYSGFKKYSVINASGDSMQPNIHDEDRLIVEHWNGEQITDNKVYIFRYKDQIFIKRLVLNLDQIVVKSDNKEYQTRYIEANQADDFQVIGKIVGLMRANV